MFKFHIHPDIDIPTSVQLLNQMSFAIACGQYPPGYKLPSTRQLAMQTGLHRNTISKVYRQLEEMGLVDSRASSGIYVNTSDQVKSAASRYPSVGIPAQAYQEVKQGLDLLLRCGCSLQQAKDLFLAEIEWRLRCSTELWVCVPQHDIGSGQLILEELQPVLSVPVQLIALEDLPGLFAQTSSITLITIPYFTHQVAAVSGSARVITLDIYDFAAEIALLKQLPANTCVGLVSVSSPLMAVSQIVIYGMRGEDVLVLTTEVTNSEDVKQVIRRSEVVLCDRPSLSTIKTILRVLRAELIRLPQIRCIPNYVSQKALEELVKELSLLGMGITR
jgi:GntR family transcriptional regulator